LPVRSKISSLTGLRRGGAWPSRRRVVSGDECHHHTRARLEGQVGYPR
jgi:hypothetical protein